MTITIEVMKQAVECLEILGHKGDTRSGNAITALRAAIEAAEKVEPTHCMCRHCKDGTLHDSDCSVHNEPAYRNGPCDCSVITPVAWMSPGKERLEFSTKSTVYGSHTIPLYLHPPSEEIESLRKDAARLRSVLNEFDNPYQIGDVWQWIGPTPETVDAAMQEKQP